MTSPHHLATTLFVFADEQVFVTIQAEILRAFTEFSMATLEKYRPVLKVNPQVAKVPIIVSTQRYHGNAGQNSLNAKPSV